MSIKQLGLIVQRKVFSYNLCTTCLSKSGVNWLNRCWLPNTVRCLIRNLVRDGGQWSLCHCTRLIVVCKLYYIRIIVHSVFYDFRPNCIYRLFLTPFVPNAIFVWNLCREKFPNNFFSFLKRNAWASEKLRYLFSVINLLFSLLWRINIWFT